MIIYAKRDKNTQAFLPLKVHALDTAGTAIKLWEETVPDCICSQWKSILGSTEVVKRLIQFVALAHDTGKLTADFQSMIKKEKPTCEIRHELAGEVILVKHGCPISVAAVIGAHHGTTQDKLYNDTEELLAMWSDRIFYGSSQELPKLTENWIQFLLNQSGYQSMAEAPEIPVEFQALLTGLLIEADWIASNESYFPLFNKEGLFLDINQEERIAQAWALYPHTKPWLIDTIDASPENFKSTFGFFPNSLQTAVAEIILQQEKPGLMVIESPTGSGKTEAALKATELISARFGTGGLFFGLPTQATANERFDLGYRWIGHQIPEHTQSIRLAHGDAMLQEQYTSISYRETDDGTRIIRNQWLEDGKRALLADFVFGTVDQLLKAGTAGKHCLLQHFALAGKTIIIDECHAYDAYMNVFLDNVLYWLGKYHTPVIIMSATLPRKRKESLIRAYTGSKQKELIPISNQNRYPLMTWTDGDLIQTKAVDLKTEARKVEIRKILFEEMEENLLPVLRAGGCAGIIVNTVKKAQELYEAFQSFDPILFHSRFTAYDRSEIENTLKARCGKQSSEKDRKGLLVIGTQVMEQSLDVDFDALFTELCPMELLLQRIEHRHAIHDPMRPENCKTAVCYVIVPKEIKDHVYQPFLLRQTMRFLPDNIVLPTDIPVLVNHVFEEYDPDDPEYRQFDEQERGIKSKAQTCMTRKDIRGTIQGMLNCSMSFSEYAVRQGRMPCKVIVLMQTAEGMRFVPWAGGEAVKSDLIPDYELTKKILLQRVSLPGSITEEMLEEAKENTAQSFPLWEKVSVLKDMAVLLLDETCTAVIGGVRFSYTQTGGLQKIS